MLSALVMPTQLLLGAQNYPGRLHVILTHTVISHIMHTSRKLFPSDIEPCTHSQSQPRGVLEGKAQRTRALEQEFLENDPLSFISHLGLGHIHFHLTLRLTGDKIVPLHSP